MKNSKLYLIAASFAAFVVSVSPSFAQWQTPNHSVPVGRGAGTGFNFAAPGTAGLPLTSNGASSDPTFQSITGGSSGQIQYNNSGVLGGFTASGDCTITPSTGAVVCTKTNGANFGPFATTPSGTTATALLDQFTSSLKGVVPGSGGGTTNFLRADGTWATPPGGGGGNGCTTSASLGMDATGATANDTQLAAWIATLPTSTTFTACIEFGTGVFLFNSRPVIPLPNPLWSSSSTTSNTVGTGTKTFTVPSCTGIPTTSPRNTVTIYHTVGTGPGGTNNTMTGTVTSCSSTTLTANITSVTGSGTFASWGMVQQFLGGATPSGVTFKGQGADTTELRFASGISGPLFQFSGIIQSLTVKDMSITTQSTAAGQACLTLTNSYPFFGAVNNLNQIRNVVCRGADGYGANDWWEAGFVNNYVSNVNYDSVMYFGDKTAGTHGTGMIFNNPGTAGCVPASTSPWQCGENYNITNSYFVSANIGLFVGPNTQYINIASSQFVNGVTGVSVGGASSWLQGLNIQQNIFFVTGRAIIDTIGFNNVFIANNFIAMNSAVYAIELDTNKNFTIIGNQFNPFSAGTTLGAITIPGPSTGQSTIIGNTFDGGGNTITNCINLGSTTLGVVAAANSFKGCTNNILNASSNNAVGIFGAGATTGSFSVYNGVVITR